MKTQRVVAGRYKVETADREVYWIVEKHYEPAEAWGLYKVEGWNTEHVEDYQTKRAALADLETMI